MAGNGLILIACSGGALAALREVAGADGDGGDGGGGGGAEGAVSVVGAAQLPADVFSSPAVTLQGDGSVLCVFGCRDDHLYCLEVA